MGDRTVLDAFIPACQAYSKKVQAGSSGLDALRAAVDAAEQGALQTREMLPKTGRASWIGKRVVGEVDGGAWLCYKVYQVLYETLSNENSEVF
ncbi:dihydroxyacetone kinase subunit L [Fodinisporobacter ferrooxydans]|uniref:Dihydroxyacetone kinase subunit L n=1 Tax=Fodinisporobacter ferrooxydans TaxID=2901836 RepID=A0ABY4CR36_9BACL|nr:dihydroxyacetone kinase subunit L [Alicyclobacillaceae bacterium MYW30-H2]